MRIIRNFNIKKILSFFLQQPRDPFFNAKGAAIGIFLGCFPFVGFQTIVGVFIAKVLRGNIFLAAAGTWISNPLTFAPLYYFNFKVGSALLQSSYEIKIDKDLFLNDLWKQSSAITLRLLLGSALVASFLAPIIGFIVFVFYKRKRN